ncbi:MAG: hypothetical protein RDU76_06105 [Candidatus Edwardsbacteria bacterium]|nr:hypothetical protein [Candidatus Edwardsbacteria bacterium]
MKGKRATTELWRREIKCSEKVDRGYGRRSLVIYQSSIVNGPYMDRYTVSQPMEIDKFPSRVGVVVTHERLKLGDVLKSIDPIPIRPPAVLGARKI